MPPTGRPPTSACAAREAATFGAIYTQDLVMITALGLGKPWTWSRKEWTIDVLDKAVHITATSAIFDRAVGPHARSW